MDRAASDSQTSSHSHNGPPNGSSEDRLPELVEALQEEVLAKDELVQALTVQLEQLAEQLDRVQRSGADRKRSNALPPDVVEGHRKVVTELERVVHQWEDMQAGVMLGRIEVQLSELRDLIVDRLSGAALPRPGSGGSSHASSQTSVVLERISVSSAPAPAPSEHQVLETSATAPEETPPSALPSMWESLKSQMLEETPTITAEDLAPDATPLIEPAAPSPIVVADATPEELETALDDRDAYITFLLRKVRQLSVVPQPPDWVSLEQVPEELCRTLESHGKQLEELLRNAEIELSIERARIGREQARLRQQQESIEKQMRRLGLKTLDEQAAESPEASPTDRRWVRFLGLPKGK